jgi:GNAT superfamily N-acetyltransferase
LEGVEIVDFRPEHRARFAELNRRWIEEHFELEPRDLELLAEPEREILARGGHVLCAVRGARVVGVCALLRDGQRFELAKMAVDEEVRGRGIGRALLEAALARARREGARGVWLRTSPLLGAAFALYERSGFRPVPGTPPQAGEYRRGGVFLELDLVPGSGPGTPK